MKSIKFCIILFIGMTVSLMGQKLNTQFVPYGSKGLPNETVYNVYKGEKGKLWLLSDRKFFLYDGNRSRQFVVNLSPENRISFLKPITDSLVYVVSTEAAVYRLVRNDTLPAKYAVEKLFLMPNKEYIRNLWLGGQDSLYVQADSTIRLYTLRNSKLKTVFSVKSKKEYIYRGIFHNGAYYVNRNNKILYKVNHGRVDSFKTDKQYSSMFQYKDHLYTYYAPRKQMVEFSLENGFKILRNIKIPIKNTDISQFIFINENLYFITTSSAGAALFNANGESLIIDRNSGLPGNKVYFANYIQNLIILTSQAGIVYIKSPYTLNFDKSCGMYDQFSWAIKKFKGKYYVATSSGVVTLNKIDNFHYKIARVKEFGSKATYSLYQQAPKFLWIIADEERGIYRYDGKNLVNAYEQFRPINNAYWNFSTSDHSGNLWLLAQAKVIRYDGKNFYHYPLPDEKEKYVLQIKTNYKNEIYAQTENGIYRYDHEQFRRIYSGQNIQDFFALGSDTLIVHFSDEETVFITNKQARHLTDRVCSKLIYNLDYVPKLKMFFLSDEAGVHLWNAATDSVLHLNDLNGLIYSETNQYSYCFEDDGMFVGTPRGVTYVPYENLPSIKNTKLYAEIKTIFYDKKGENFRLPEDGLPVSVPYAFRNVEFRIVPHYYFNDNPFKMDIQFEPLHKKPLQNVSDYNFNFTYLEPGQYNFKVRAFWKYPLYTFFKQHIKFRVKPPFYQTKLFYFLDVLFLILFIYGFSYLRSIRLKRSNYRLQKLVHERTKDLETYKSILESVLKNIKDPMIVFSEDGKYILKNRFPIPLKDGTLEELINVLPANHGEKIMEIYEDKKTSFYQTDEPFSFHGEKYYLYFNSLVVKEKLRGYSLLMINVTRLLENEILQTRMETLEQLVATFSHYLNNYLQGIVLHLDLYRLYNSNFKPEKAMHDITVSVTNIKKMMNNFEKAVENNAVILGEYAGIEDTIFKLDSDDDKTQ